MHPIAWCCLGTTIVLVTAWQHFTSRRYIGFRVCPIIQYLAAILWQWIIWSFTTWRLVFFYSSGKLIPSNLNDSSSSKSFVPKKVLRLWTLCAQNSERETWHKEKLLDRDWERERERKQVWNVVVTELYERVPFWNQEQNNHGALTWPLFTL